MWSASTISWPYMTTPSSSVSRAAYCAKLTITTENSGENSFRTSNTNYLIVCPYEGTLGQTPFSLATPLVISSITLPDMFAASINLGAIIRATWINQQGNIVAYKNDFGVALQPSNCITNDLLSAYNLEGSF